jgi:Na+-translocating ferredoxin:NAD+ oxidoreductase RnfC subunit
MTALLLRLLPFKWWIVGGAFALVCSAWLVQTLRVQVLRADLAESMSLRAQEREASAEAARIQSEEYRIEDQRRASAIRSVVGEAIKLSEAVALDANSVRAAHDRLLQRYRAALSRRAPDDPAPATGSPPTAAADDLSTELLGRVSEAAGLLAAEADKRGIAGNACVKSYEALTK